MEELMRSEVLFDGGIGGSDCCSVTGDRVQEVWVGSAVDWW
jgi:hypothetical protein